MTTAQKTRCPHCKSAFRVTPAQLDAAGGIVRCGVCFKTFDAIDSLESDPTTDTTKDNGDYLIDDNFDLSLLEKDASATARPTEHSPAAPAIQHSTVDETPKDAFNRNRAARPAHDPASPAQSEAPSTTTATENPNKAPTAKPLPAVPSLNDDEERLALDSAAMAHWRPEASTLIDSDKQGCSATNRGPLWLWAAASTLALFLLLAQLIYFNSLAIHRGSTLWPVASTFCDITGCPLQPRLDTSRILTGDLMVRTHPRIANALFVDAVILNQGDFSQPFPNLRLIFENLQGAVIAQRVFTPKDYLEGEVSNATLMPSKRPIKLELEILDPGKDAVSFRLLVER